MGSKFDFIVQVLGGEVEMAPAFRGTGLLIASDRVLTCRHVVMEQIPYGQPTDAPLPQLWVQRAAGPRLLVEKPVLAANWDLAVLELATALPVEPPPFLWGLSQALEERLRATPLFVIGYAQTEPQGPLWQHSLKDLWLLPSARESSQILTAVQLHGGIPAGCSGAPVLLPLGEHWACAGMVYLGGEHSATSRLILADPVVEFLHQVGIHSIARLDAVRVLAAVPLDLAAAAALIEQPIDAAQLSNPYRGLAAFRTVDAPYFFGRQADTEDLLGAVLHHPLVTLVGASGSGKSSLIFAGLVPQLTRENRWLLAAFRPKSDPFGELARPLIPYLYPSLTDRLEQEAKRLVLAHTLIQQRLSLIHVVELLAEEHPEQRLLLIADQFEELYTQNLPPDQQRRFLDNLLALVQRQEQALPGTLLLSLRADFLNQALSYGPLADALDHYPKKILGPLTEPALRAAIEGPAAQLGVRLEAGLSDRILQDLGQEPGSLPLLEFALTELWERQIQAALTHQSYEAIGGVTEALAHYADKVLQRFQGQEAQLRRIFTQLVRPGEGTEDTRQLATREQVGEANWPLVKQLADQRLVVTSREDVSDKAKIKETVEVVHEALIHHWQPLRDWINQDRQFRVWQNRLRQALQEWEEKQHDEGALLRGARLTEAEEQLEAHTDELSSVERGYISTSRALRDRKAVAYRHRVRNVIAGLAAGLLLAIGLMLWAFSERNEAEAQRKVAKEENRVAAARYLAAEAILAFNRYTGPDLLLSGLLAVESLKRTRTVQGYLAWERVIRVLPPKPLYIPHEARVSGMTFISNSRNLVTTTEDGRISIWDTTTGERIRELPGGQKSHLIVSPKGSRAVTEENDGVWLWEVPVWQRLRKLTEESPGRLVFSGDGRRLAMSRWQQPTITIWDAMTGEEFTRLTEGGEIHEIVFSPDGDRLAALSGNEDRIVRLWDVITGKRLPDLLHKPLRGHHEMPQDAGSASVGSAAFSPDGRYLASTANYGDIRQGFVYLWDAITGRQVSTFAVNDRIGQVAFSPDSQRLAVGGFGHGVRIFDFKTGEQLQYLDVQEWPAALNNYHVQINFSPDGSRLLIESSSDDTYGLEHYQRTSIWNTGTGELLFALPIEGYPWVELGGTQLAVTNREHPVYLWDVSAPAPIAWQLEGRYPPSSCTPDERYFSSEIDEDAGLATIRNRYGEILATLPFGPGRFGPYGITDGQRMVSGREPTKGHYLMEVWDLPSGTVIARKESEFVPDLSISPDGKYVLLRECCQPGTVSLLQADTLEEIAVLGNHNQLGLFSPDSQWLASVLKGSASIQLYAIPTAKETLKETLRLNPAGGFSRFAFTPDSSRLAVVAEGSIRLWDLFSGEEVMRLPVEHPANCVKFSTDGRYMVAFTDLTASAKGRTATVFDLRTGNAITRLHHDAEVTAAAFSPDGEYLVTGAGRMIRIWEVEKGRELVRIDNREQVVDAYFGADGRTVFSGYVRRYKWRWQHDDLINELCARLTRNFSHTEWRNFVSEKEYSETCPGLPVPAQ